MIANQEDKGETSRETNVSEPGLQDNQSMLSTAKTPTEPTEIVIGAYSAAARRGNGGAVNAFDAAVRAYMACYPDTHPAVAARIVADIISHRS